MALTTKKVLALIITGIDLESAELGRAMITCKSLKCLWLKDLYMHKAFKQALFVGLGSNNTLIDLYLSRCNAGDDSASLIRFSLMCNSSLETLCIDAADIGSSGACALASGLCINTSVTCFQLSDDSIGCKGGVALANMLRKNRTLIAVKLMYLDVVADKELCQAVATTLRRNDSLRVLHLRHCGFPHEARVEFRDIVSSRRVVQEFR